MSNFTLRCQIVHGAKLSAVPNCPRCQIVHFWPAVPNCPRCQIVHFYTTVPNCPLLHYGAKLSANMGGAKLSTVLNCPLCQVVLGPYKYHSDFYQDQMGIWIIFGPPSLPNTNAKIIQRFLNHSMNKNIGKRHKAKKYNAHFEVLTYVLRIHFFALHQCLEMARTSSD